MKKEKCAVIKYRDKFKSFGHNAWSWQLKSKGKLFVII